MSNKTNKQAASLEELFNEIQQDSEQENVVQHLPKDESIPKIDVLNLPPRKEVHGSKNQRLAFKISKPFGRLILVFILLIIIGIGTYLVWGEDLETFINTF